jgi:hypothetical protein
MGDEKRGETFVLKRESETAPIEFTTFLLGLASTALIHLGQAPHPETGKAETNLALAKESVELLGMLRDKTRGNLTAEEENIFEDILADLRLRYVEARKH